MSNSNTFPATPPPPGAFVDGGSTTYSPVFPTKQPTPPNYVSAPSSSTASSVVIVIIIIASAVIVSASIYILLRFLSRRYHRTSRNEDDFVLRSDGSRRFQAGSLLDNLPLFTFRSVNGDLAGGDCAVCLSKFEPHDQMRLLPLCCHAFHAACIDTWIVANHTCPLCRSTVLPSDSDNLLDKIASGRGSFRIEIGSISRRREAADGGRRSYSMGSFDYILDGNGYEVPVGSTAVHRGEAFDCTSVDKESSAEIPPPGEAIAAEVSSGRNWLREYVDRLASASMSSRATSFRSSGRFFSGSSRRSDPVTAAEEDLEANHRVGEEISELFRWLSGI